jgi:hypothetical protein
MVRDEVYLMVEQEMLLRPAVAAWLRKQLRTAIQLD